VPGPFPSPNSHSKGPQLVSCCEELAFSRASSAFFLGRATAHWPPALGRSLATSPPGSPVGSPVPDRLARRASRPCSMILTGAAGLLADHRYAAISRRCVHAIPMVHIDEADSFARLTMGTKECCRCPPPSSETDLIEGLQMPGSPAQLETGTCTPPVIPRPRIAGCRSRERDLRRAQHQIAGRRFQQVHNTCVTAQICPVTLRSDRPLLRD